MLGIAAKNLLRQQNKVASFLFFSFCRTADTRKETKSPFYSAAAISHKFFYRVEFDNDIDSDSYTHSYYDSVPVNHCCSI